MEQRQVPSIFSRHRRTLRQARARALGRADGSATFIADDMIEEVLERLDFMRLSGGRLLAIAAQTADSLGKLSERGFDVTVRSPDAFNEESPYLESHFDLIVSLGTLDTVNDLPGALLHARNALNDEGLFIGQMIGAGSLPVLRQIMLAADGDRPAARIHPQVDNRAATALLERAGFKRQVVDSRSLSVSYRSFERLIRDLREQALTSVLLSPSPNVGKAGLTRANEAFDALRDDEGRVTETFEILTLTGWR